MNELSDSTIDDDKREMVIWRSLSFRDDKIVNDSGVTFL